MIIFDGHGSNVIKRDFHFYFFGLNKSCGRLRFLQAFKNKKMFVTKMIKKLSSFTQSVFLCYIVELKFNCDTLSYPFALRTRDQ